MTPSDHAAAPSAEPPARPALQRALFRHRFRRLLVEMAAAVEHSALSPALSQRGELACALLDCDGYTVAEHGAALRAAAIGPQVRSALASHAPLAPGQVLLVSDPQHGGTDLGTLTLIAIAIDSDGVQLGYLALSGDRGDCLRPPVGPPESQVDIDAEALPLPPAAPSPGAAEPLAELPPAVGPRYRAFHTAAATGTVGLGRRREHEGWELPPTPLTETVAQTLAQKQRDPIAALADIKALRGGLRLGGQHLRALDKRYGAAAIRQAMRQELSETQAAIRVALQRIPAGVYAFADSLDDDGVGASDLPIRATLHLAHAPAPSRLSCDFRESAEASAGAVNTTPTVVQAAVRSALAALLPAGAAVNDGLLQGAALLLRPGSLLSAGPAHAVSGGATETALRIVDVVLGALGQALPQPLQAASAGTASLLTLRAPDAGSAPEGSPAPGRLYLREPLAGGQGARPHADGVTGRHALGPGPRASSCELLEQRLPVRVLRCAVRSGSGGGGVRSGGDGLVRELLLLAALHVELCGDRRRRPPYGLGGGGPGQLGRDTLLRDGIERRLPPKARLLLRPGDILRTESPGGGGYGDPTRAAFYAALLS